LIVVLIENGRKEKHEEYIIRYTVQSVLSLYRGVVSTLVKQKLL